ncbi:MAG: hypothetical protein ACMV1B_13195 [Prevotella sp.]
MELTKGTVTNTTNHSVLIQLPDIKFRRTWQKDSSIKVDIEVLREAIYDVGFKAFMDEGLLFIEEKEIRVELGLEEEDAEKPLITILKPAQMTRLIKAATIDEFKSTLSEITKEQALSLVDMAISEKSISMDKLMALKEKTGIDVVKAIELERQNEENVTIKE